MKQPYPEPNMPYSNPSLPTACPAKPSINSGEIKASVHPLPPKPTVAKQSPQPESAASKMSDTNGGGTGTPGNEKEESSMPAPSEHLNIKVTDNNNEVFFKIKRTTALKKLMDAFCDRSGKHPSSVRFLFDGQRVQPSDTPDTLEMSDGDTLEVHQEQIGGCLA